MSPYERYSSSNSTVPVVDNRNSNVALQDTDEIFQLPLGVPLIDTPNGRVLYITRHGESMYNLENRIGGNPSLSNRGQQYAQKLGQYVNKNLKFDKVWTSELSRTLETSAHIKDIEKKRIMKPELNEIMSGIFDDLSYEEFKDQSPIEYKERELNKLTYRYPEGESYLDVCSRIEPVMSEMDTGENLLVICHQAVIRCILARLQRTPAIEIPYIKVPLHSLLKITYLNGQNTVEVIPLNVACVSTYRPKTDPTLLSGLGDSKLELKALTKVSSELKKTSLESPKINTNKLKADEREH
ncbi:hypothetical protein TCAL_06342 [Tigriopus californicus]|uniref:Uncharacterized protein n=1 Tax=Tigriopus californicus TaxID=6832 RepID=A0A553PCH2_TIGCA|nr:6-phosphofructo-2-kinase/fructose-2,6-bisphosphatase 4-like isoform X2 [Tigriopus californicus]TRY75385.1 hypothetical protein TCAL_06342 [Tigriopus californicus]|eukprot:TCALIF_06342-PA protein Name:"Similar to Pfkfb4 6-phosphofructo-2-kinase/fructose-2,6-bisphosphatase 4 (Mus musculus)" AED:0.01 eAED:0.01 QI:0/1/0.66/1/1/1/3/415/296